MAYQKNRPWRNGVIILATVAVLVGFFVLINYRRSPARTTDPNPNIGGSHPIVLRGRLLGGGQLNTTKWKGKAVVVDFWATWCPWCIREAPYIAKLYSRYHHHGLEVAGVSINDTAAAVRRFRKAHPKDDWPQFLDEHQSNEALAQRFGITGLPTDLIIDQQGVLRHALVGFDPGRLVSEVRKLLVKATPKH